MRPCVFWHNFKTGETDTRHPDSDEIAKEYISQNIAAQNLYEIHREMGKSIPESMVEVFKIQSGVTAQK